MLYSRIDNNGRQTITLFFEDEDLPMPISDTHPKFGRILQMCDNGELTEASDEEVINILNDNTLSKWAPKESDQKPSAFLAAEIDEIDAPEEVIRGLHKILKSFDPNSEDHIRAIINFLDRVENNPADIEVGKFLQWAMRNGIVLTEYGSIVGYKSMLRVEPGDYGKYFDLGIKPNGDSTTVHDFVHENHVAELFRPAHQGPGITDGVSWNLYIPMYVGSTVEMPRDRVDSSGQVACSVGLHVGNYNYAEWFNNGEEGETVGLVLVAPEDIISVPDYDFDKYRVCRYRIIHAGIESELESTYYVGETYEPVVESPEPIAGFQGADEGNLSKDTAFSRLLGKLKSIFNR